MNAFSLREHLMLMHTTNIKENGLTRFCCCCHRFIFSFETWTVCVEKRKRRRLTHNEYTERRMPCIVRQALCCANTNTHKRQYGQFVVQCVHASIECIQYLSFFLFFARLFALPHLLAQLPFLCLSFALLCVFWCVYILDSALASFGDNIQHSSNDFLIRFWSTFSRLLCCHSHIQIAGKTAEVSSPRNTSFYWHFCRGSLTKTKENHEFSTHWMWRKQRETNKKKMHDSKWFGAASAASEKSHSTVPILIPQYPEPVLLLLLLLISFFNTIICACMCPFLFFSFSFFMFIEIFELQQRLASACIDSSDCFRQSIEWLTSWTHQTPYTAIKNTHTIAR